MNRQISNFSEIRKKSELKNRSIITQTETQRKKNEIYRREHPKTMGQYQTNTYIIRMSEREEKMGQKK